MSSIKCNQCGLPNFSSSEHCKRCKASLFASPAPAETTARAAESKDYLAVYDESEPRRFSLSPLRILLLVILVASPVAVYFYQSNAAHEEQVKKDKEFDQKRRQEDQRARPVGFH